MALILMLLVTHLTNTKRCKKSWKMTETLSYGTHLTLLNAETTFVEGTRTQKPLKIIETLSSWYLLESSHWVLSDEYPFARVSVFFQLFSHYFVLVKLASSSIRVKGTQWELSNEYQHDKVQRIFKNLCILVLWTKVASALEGLNVTYSLH